MYSVSSESDCDMLLLTLIWCYRISLYASLSANCIVLVTVLYCDVVGFGVRVGVPIPHPLPYTTGFIIENKPIFLQLWSTRMF